jgi:hypothetical protein
MDLKNRKAWNLRQQEPSQNMSYVEAAFNNYTTTASTSQSTIVDGERKQ